MYEFITGRKRGQAMLSEQAESCVGRRDVTAETGPSWGRRVYSPGQARMGGLDALCVLNVTPPQKPGWVKKAAPSRGCRGVYHPNLQTPGFFQLFKRSCAQILPFSSPFGLQGYAFKNSCYAKMHHQFVSVTNYSLLERGMRLNESQKT